MTNDSQQQNQLPNKDTVHSPNKPGEVENVNQDGSTQTEDTKPAA